MARARYAPVNSWDNVPCLIDIPFAVRLLGLSYDCIVKQCKAGSLPAFKIGGSWRIKKEDLLSHIEQMKPQQDNVIKLQNAPAEKVRESQ